MGAARRGYVLIAVLWTLALVGAVAAAFSYATRVSVSQARAETERAQAYYAARGACIQSVKDLAAGVRRAEITMGVRRTARERNVNIDESSGGVQIGDLPVFPPEMAAAGGFLGAIADRMNQMQRPAPSNAGNDDGSGRSGGRSGGGGGRAGVEEEEDLAPLLMLGRGTMAFAGATVEVWLESETGKININTASRSALERLLVALGETAADARLIVDDIERYRVSRMTQGDPLKKPAAPARRGGPDDPLLGRELRTIEELANVESIDAARLERFLEVLTVYGDGRIDPNYAPEPVLIAAGVVDRRPLQFAMEMQAARERITPQSFRLEMGGSAYDRVSGNFVFGAPPVFTARTRATVGDSSARYLIRVEPSAGKVGATGMTRLLESREDWL